MRKNRCEFVSSDKRLENGFNWAVKQALEYAHDNEKGGPCYEAALPMRRAYCMRDFSHQVRGAHYLGLEKHNRNMMKMFNTNISETKDYCSYWEITFDGDPAPVDYTSDEDFWYNLPANYDIITASEKLYNLTGDKSYLTGDDALNFMSLSMDKYTEKWDRDGDGIPDRIQSDGRRGIASYDEGNVDGFASACDTVVLMITAYNTIAKAFTMSGDSERAEKAKKKSDEIKALFESRFYNKIENRYYPFMLVDGTCIGNFSGINSHMPLVTGVIDDKDKRDGQIRFLLRNEETELNVEDRSYLPSMLWENGYDDDAYRIFVKMTADDYKRREYPEVSYAGIDAVVTGLMGFKCDYDTRTINTKSHTDSECKLISLPIWNGYIDITHDGKKSSTVTNNTGERITWISTVGEKSETVIVESGETVRVNGV